jgi:hypothetical protein
MFSWEEFLRERDLNVSKRRRDLILREKPALSILELCSLLLRPRLRKE